MNKQLKILSYLNNTATVLCVFFSFFLLPLDNTRSSWIFCAAATILAANNWFIYKSRYTSAFFVLNITCNILMLIFDAGYRNPVNSYVYYFPLLLSNFLLARSDQRWARILITSFTLCCVFLTNFTSLTPRLAAGLHDSDLLKIASFVNISTALIACLVVLFFINDISRKTEAELIHTREKIREAAERWDYALSNNQEGVWDLNIPTGEIYYSLQWKKMLGYGDGDIANEVSEWERLVHADDLQEAREAVDNHLRGYTEVYEHIHRMLCKDGSYKWIYAKGKVCEHNEAGKPKRFIGTHSDITAQKLSQVALIQSQQLLNSINQNIDVALCRTSASPAKLLYVNRGYIRLFRYADEETALQSDPAEVYYHPEDRNRLVEQLEQHGLISNQEVQYKKKDGTVFWGLLSATRIVDENGNASYDGALREITQIKEIEAELIKAKEQAEKASNAKSQFLSTMSHEIRTPMNAVIGVSNLLMQDNPKPDQVENLSVLKFSAENLLTLINNILDFTKIEAGKIEFEEVPVNIDQLLSSIIHSHIIEAKQKGIDLRFNTTVAGTFLTDPTRVSQIMNNLVANAIKFTEKGAVEISISAEEETATSALLKFAITDTGIGIDPDKIGLIFESFSQENKDISRRFGGTGLGLSITKLLLELMNSRIDVQSEKGKGSVFSFSLRLNKSTALPANKTTGENGHELAGMHILLVEDNQMNIMLINKFLKRWEVSVDVALNGSDAIDKVKSGTYDLVLMDLHMPEIDGYQATTAIRRFNQQIPIYALTADAFADTRTRALACGMNDFISKPFNPDELYNKIARLHFNSVNS